MKKSVLDAKVSHILKYPPICVSSKKICDDEEHWHSIEDFLSKNADLEFTHSICEDCYKKLYF